MATNFEKWQSMTQDPRIVGFFAGLFHTAGVRVTDANEEFTAFHRGDHIEFREDLDPSAVDYVVEIDSGQVDRMVGYAEKGELDLQAQYRITRVLFTPTTAATLKNPVLSNPILRRLARVEDHVHITLTSPVPEEEDYSHTLVYVKGQWVVTPGLHGSPRRRFNITMDEALAYHRRVLAAIKAHSWMEWIKYSRWYVAWRKTVSTRP